MNYMNYDFLRNKKVHRLKPVLRAVLLFTAIPLSAQTVARIDPEIQQIVKQISQDNIAATLKKLASFETRGNFSDPELAKDEVYEAYSKNKSLTILRAGQQLTINPNTALSTAHPGYFPKPGTTVTGDAPPTPPSTDQQNPLNQIQNIPTH